MLNIVAKLPRSITDKIKNSKDEMSYTGFGLRSGYSDCIHARSYAPVGIVKKHLKI